MRFAGTQLSNFIDDSNYDGISKTASQSRAEERMAVDKAAGLVEQADINAEAMIKSAKFGASATVAQGAAAGQSAMFSGLGNMASGIAGGFANRGSTNIGTNRGVSPISQPHASGIGREALGGYDF
jgi:hypothetical protein